MSFITTRLNIRIQHYGVMMPTIQLRWDKNNEIEHGYRVYRSRTPINRSNPPEPIDTLPRGTSKYQDDDDQLINGVTYYYMVGAFIDDHVELSDVVSYISITNTMYAITTNSRLLSITDNVIDWETDLGHTDSRFYVHDNNTIFLIRRSIGIDIFDASSGTLLHAYAFAGQIVDITTTFDQTTVYILDNSNTCYMMSQPSMTPIGSFTYNASSSSFTRFICRSGDYIYIGGDMPTLQQFNLNGTPLWELSIADIADMASIKNGLLYAKGRVLYRINHAGVVTWELTLPTIIENIAVDRQDNISLTSNGYVYGISPSGQRLWDLNLNLAQSIEYDVAGQIYVISYNRVNTFTYMGDFEGVYENESIRSVKLPSRVLQPEIITPILDSRFSNSTVVVGVEDNSSSGIKGVSFNITHDDSSSAITERHDSENIIRQALYSITHDFTLQT